MEVFSEKGTGQAHKACVSPGSPHHNDIGGTVVSLYQPHTAAICLAEVGKSNWVSIASRVRASMDTSNWVTGLVRCVPAGSLFVSAVGTRSQNFHDKARMCYLPSLKSD